MDTEQKNSSTPLKCRLRRNPGPSGYRSPFSGQIELENNSSDPLDIVHNSHVLQFLDFKVTDADGKVLPTSFYGDIFGAVSPRRPFRLLPGEKYVHNVSLLGNLAKEYKKPGCYTIVAIYKCEGIFSASEPYTLELDPEKLDNLDRMKLA